MNAKPFNRKYDAMYITESTSHNDIAEFIKNSDAVKTRICGMGFGARCYHLINSDTGVMEVDVGDVIVRNSYDEFAIIDSSAYSMIFKSDND